MPQSQSQSQSSLPFDTAAAAAAAAAASGLAAARTLTDRAQAAEPGVWDELRTPDGSLRRTWQAFAASLPPPPAPLDVAQDLERRVGQVAQRIRLDGVTHNVHGDDDRGGGANRPWSLELLPLLIEPADWAAIEAGVVQRAELLQLMLADLYGPQKLLQEGLLPSALLFRHPGYLRPMVGVEPAVGGPQGLRLFIVAFDLARGPDGLWSLVAQRTQGPSGLGYVLHNRLVIARQFPDAFRELRVQRIASSYRRLLDTLEVAARQVAGGDTPRVVLLTAGTYTETYFEHAYLARYLGVPLVEGGDLLVRDDCLYLKTVEGLERVHGVLRRIDDELCDPLELRADSTLGVPGLLQAARAGSVVMANALGSAFLESPAVQGFMPGISMRLTGRPLLMPSLDTWWCGEAAAWADARAKLLDPQGSFFDPRLDPHADRVIRTTFPSGTRTSQLYDPAAVLGAVQDDPDAFTMQARLRFSRAPIWGDHALAARPAMVRVYAIAHGNGQWHVLPGGMTRVAQAEDGSVSMQRGATSLDTWVLTDGPVDTFSMLPQRLQVDDIARRRRPVSSRTGENLFWLGRYTERTEQAVRLARAILMLIDADNDAAAPVMQALSALAVRTGLAPVGVPTLVQSSTLFERALLAGLADATGTNGTASIAYNLSALERASQGLRERLSPEQSGLVRTMRESFGHALETAPGELPTLPQVLPALDRLALQLAAVTGAQTDRMTRDHGWRLLTVGRLSERLIGLAQCMRAFVAAQALGTVAGIDMLLELFDSLITFRARYQRHEDLLALTDLLVLDSANPRAFAGVLRRLRTEIGKLPGTAEQLAPLQALLPAEGAGVALESLRGADDAAIARVLESLAARLAQDAETLADQVGERFFTPAQGADQRV